MKTIGMIMFILSGILMFIFWCKAIMSWIGGIFGSILAILLCPGIVIFPMIYWIIEGVFPTTYFIFWGVGLIGLIVISIGEKNPIK